MKKSKLLFLTPCVAMATLPICSCSKTEWTNEDIANAIFGPTHLDEKTITSFSDELKKLSKHDLEAELFYDLFGYANCFFYSELEITLEDLYKNNDVGIKSNITQFSLVFKEEKLYASFLGYVSFVFLKDYNEDLKKNDYFMLTYDFTNLEVDLDEDDCSLYYSYPLTDNALEPIPIIGLIKMRMSGGEEEKMLGLKWMDTFYFEPYGPSNSHNWKK